MVETGRWTVSERGNLFRLGKFIESELLILHVDDHELYCEGVKNECIKPFFPNANLIRMGNGDEAYRYLWEKKFRSAFPDLIITDINHPGMRGNDLVHAIRKMEVRSDIINLIRPAPIIVLSFVALNYPDLQAEGMANAVLEKVAAADTIVDGIERAVYDRN